MTMIWTVLDARYSLDEAVGFLPQFVSDYDARPACEQFDANYIGGWHDMKVSGRGFTAFDDFMKLRYPGDPPSHAVAETFLRDERIIVYQSAFVAVIQPDGSFRVSRLD